MTNERESQEIQEFRAEPAPGGARPGRLRALLEPWLVLAAALLVTAGLSAPLVGRRTMEELVAGGPARVALLMAIQASVLLIIGILFRLPGEHGKRRFTPQAAAGVGFVGGIVALALSALTGAVGSLVGFEINEQPWLEALFVQPRALAWMLPWIVLIGPLAEEVFFRGYVFRRVRGVVGLPTALALSSLMFAVIHFNLSGLPVYFAIGVVLGWLCEKTGGLLAPVIGHVTVNAMVVVASVLGGRGVV